MDLSVINKALAFMALTACLISCQKNQEAKIPKQTARATLAIHADITALDPRVSFLSPTIHVLRMVFEGLMRLGPDGTPILGLAERYEVSEDGKTYTFHLRKSEWTDGKPVTAHDFAYSWKGTLDPANPSRSKAAFYPIKNIEAYNQGRCRFEDVGIHVIDDATLQIQLEYPHGPLLQILAYPALAPLPQKREEDEWVGNGPFLIKRHDKVSGILLVKNPHYWDVQNIHLDEVQIYVIPDIGTQDAMFQKGEIDFLGMPLLDLPYDTISRLEASRDLRQIPSTDIFWCAINTRHPILGHPKMREALASAIDRRELLNHVLPKGFHAADSILPLQMSQMTGQRIEDGNPQRAQKLFRETLHEMGLLASDLPPFTLLYSPKDIVEKAIQVIAEQWKKNLGLDIQLKCVELKTRLATMRSGAFDFGFYTWFSWIDDPLYTMVNYRSSETIYNYTGWSNPLYTRLLDQFRVAGNQEERSNFLLQAEETIMKDLPLIPIYYGALSYAQNPALRGLVITPFYEFELRWAYFEK